MKKPPRQRGSCRTQSGGRLRHGSSRTARGPDANARILVFVLPSAERWAQIELAVFDPKLYAEITSAVEAALARTRGIAPVKAPDEPPAPVFALIGVAAVVGTLIGKAIRGGKRSTKWRQRPSTKAG